MNFHLPRKVNNLPGRRGTVGESKGVSNNNNKCFRSLASNRRRLNQVLNGRSAASPIRSNPHPSVHRPAATVLRPPPPVKGAANSFIVIYCVCCYCRQFISISPSCKLLYCHCQRTRTRVFFQLEKQGQRVGGLLWAGRRE